MTANDYVTVASQFIVVGAVFECVCILIGHVISNVFRAFEGGGD